MNAQGAPTSTIQALLPHLGPELLDRQAGARLSALGARLPAVSKGGFEVRLGAGESQVDFQQCVSREPSELDRLSSLVRHAAQTSAGPAWRHLDTFVSAWNARLASIPEVWLEFDLEAGGAEGAAPHPFVGLPQGTATPSEVLALSLEAIGLLRGRALEETWASALARCVDACPEGAFVSHLGLMSARGSTQLRVNVKRLSPRGVEAYVDALSWEGDHGSLEGLLELAGPADRLTLCLDLFPEVSSRVGVECMFEDLGETSPRLGAFLDGLVERGLCAPSKRRALFAWPGLSTPLLPGAPWPDHAVVASLLGSVDRFTAFERRLSHFKLTGDPLSGVAAKAYLWFRHRWLSAAP